MKRSQEFPAPVAPSSLPPASKKLKVSPPESHSSSTQDPQAVTGSSEDGWTKVEKRKAKKTKKVEGKLDVCVSTLLCCFTLCC